MFMGRNNGNGIVNMQISYFKHRPIDLHLEDISLSLPMPPLNIFDFRARSWLRGNVAPGQTSNRKWYRTSKIDHQDSG
jgi:hypothetical protein